MVSFNTSYNANITYSSYITYNNNTYTIADITYNTTVIYTNMTATHNTIITFTTDTIHNFVAYNIHSSYIWDNLWADGRFALYTYLTYFYLTIQSTKCIEK